MADVTAVLLYHPGKPAIRPNKMHNSLRYRRGHHVRNKMYSLLNPTPILPDLDYESLRCHHARRDFEYVSARPRRASEKQVRSLGQQTEQLTMFTENDITSFFKRKLFSEPSLRVCSPTPHDFPGEKSKNHFLLFG